MSDTWFDVRLIYQLVALSREAWRRQGLKHVAGWLELVCSWLKVVVSVSKVGRIWRDLSHNLRYHDVLISLNVPQTSEFYGEQNHRERRIQYKTGG